ncbi:MAG TPA: hypothetical protein VJQ46_15850 [Gemmatimonadales bacterium]|nr:hypothetical protein [Gemmatimonadales bacterium]
MLAYVFWHWRRPTVTAPVYEEAQRRFHAALAAAPPPGFERSFSVSIRGAPWAANRGEAYEDWYLLDGSAALDPLNTAAISASRQAPHDAAAALAAGGTAGLYSLRQGTPVIPPATLTWFAKPDGMTHRDLFARLEPLVGPAGGALWCRQMTLGPALEFCLHSREPIGLPAPIAPFVVGCRGVWPIGPIGR